ncbi:divalent-cation tolerance protein CutA [Sulfurimonas diazotrophicus]|uniref:Divalent-cation tolerance protein CutA n=1 Tax=Sulfurimonas diazotrophicus TaxID=3131939 RepID=A0ABZ3H664_9BACT
MKTESIIVYCTCPDPVSAKDIAEAVVKERLSACVNRLPAVMSHYIFKGEYCEDEEVLLIIKTTADAFERLRARIETLHPYDVPEIIAAPVVAGNSGYLAWLQESVK